MRWLILTSILLVAVSGQTNRRFVVWKDADEVSKCIERKLPGFSKSYFDKYTRIRIAVANLISEKFAGVETMQEVAKILVPLYTYKLRTDPRFSKFKDDVNFWKKTDLAIQVALLACSKPLKDPRVSNNVLLLPNFHNESYELANALNFILVNWPVPLLYIVRTQVGRATLRRYSENSRSAFQRALVLYGVQLRGNFRMYWSLRAQRFFSGDDEPPYIPHCFVMPFGFPHTYYRIPGLMRSGPLEHRDPPTSRENRERILNIHVADRPGDIGDEFDVYSYYEENSMTQSDYYLESHRDQFHRVNLFVEELEASGVRTDEDDVHYGPLPYDVMPRRFQAILYDDEAFRDYLLERRNLEVRMGDPEDPIVQRLNKSARVCMEDLMALTNRHPLRRYNVSIGSFVNFDGAESTTVSTTSTSTSTEMPPQGSSRVRVNCFKSFFRKCFPKDDDNDEEHYYEMSDKTTLYKQDSDAADHSYNSSYGYATVEDDDHSRFSFLMDESSFFVRSVMNIETTQWMLWRS